MRHFSKLAILAASLLSTAVYAETQTLIGSATPLVLNHPVSISLQNLHSNMRYTINCTISSTAKGTKLVAEMKAPGTTGQGFSLNGQFMGTYPMATGSLDASHSNVFLTGPDFKSTSNATLVLTNTTAADFSPVIEQCIATEIYAA